MRDREKDEALIQLDHIFRKADFMSGKKIAIVTGASSGMGREMVYLLADHFAALEEIWVIARRKDRLEELVGKVPVSLRILPFDLSGEEDLRRLSGLLSRNSRM